LICRLDFVYLHYCKSFDAGKDAWHGDFSCGQNREPSVCCTAQGVQVYSAKLIRDFFQLLQARFEQGFGSVSIASRVVMECGGKLNQTLQKHFVMFRGDEPAGAGKPKFFPNLVGFEKLSGIEENNALTKFRVIEFGNCRDDCAPVGLISGALRRAFIIAEGIRGPACPGRRVQDGN